MGDLKVGESFEDRVYITDSTGAAKTGLAPTCTIIDESGNRTAGTVAEMASGWYKVTDFTPDAAGTWCLEWAVTGTYIIQYPNKLFKVGGGTLADIETALTFQHQADAVVANVPAQNTWYTILNTTANVRLISVILKMDTLAEDIAIQITIDGQVLPATQASAIAGTYYYAGFTATTNVLAFGTTNWTQYRAFLLEGRSVKVEMRKTTNNGANWLTGIVKYAKR